MKTAWQVTGIHRLPRWRFALCSGEHPQRKARRLLMQLRQSAPESAFSCSECHENLNLALVAIHSGPVGADIADLRDPQAAAPTGWSNPQDRALIERGFDAAVLYSVKLAASRARTQTEDTVLSRYTLVPLPHVKGQLLVKHPSGWHARALAWWQAGALLSLAWCDSHMAKLRRAC